jgi:AcrR family transcriptional regulator
MGRRRDVERNRARIVAAAVEVFRRSGVNAPLTAVAEQAGVGRTTLYRHFPDRVTLLEAVMDDRIDDVERFAAEHVGEDLLERLLVEICWYMADMPGLFEAFDQALPRSPRLTDVNTRTRVVLCEALDDATRAGRVRADTTLDDVTLVMSMVGAILQGHAAGGPADVERALRICFDGLRPGTYDTPLPLREPRAARV